MKLCTVCGVVTSRAGNRCTEHARQSNRSRHNALYGTRAWQRLSGRVLRAWRGEHGNWCPGYQRPAHSAVDLTVDHVVPLAAGGAPFDIANTAVLCRSCNSTKGASTDRGGVAHTARRMPPDCAFGITANDVLAKALRSGGLPDVVVIEKIESYGMSVGAEVFDTVWWADRFAEAASRVPVVMLPRRAVKLALCGDSRARDANIRQALITASADRRRSAARRRPGRCTGSAATCGPPSRLPSRTPSRARTDAMSEDVRPVERDPLVAALARYVEALHRRYPDGPEQMRREALAAAPNNDKIVAVDTKRGTGAA